MSASAELQDLIVATLKADPAVAAIVAGRVYDIAPPQNARAFPDITLGPNDYVPEDMDCIIGREETFQIDCWTKEHGRLRACRALVDAVKDALHLPDLSLSENALVLMRVELARVIRDPDGITAHGIVQVTASIEEAG